MTSDLPRTAPSSKTGTAVRPMGRLVAGAALVLVGLLWLLDAAGAIDLRWQVVLPSLLVLVGVAVLATARRGAHGGLIATGIVLGLLVVSLPVSGGLAGIGERDERPVDVDVAAGGYDLGIGAIRVDLRDLEGVTDRATIPVSVGIGETVVRLPAGVGARVEGSVGIGEVVVLGRSQGGFGVFVEEEVAGDPVLVLEVSAGIGRVEVTR